LVQIANHGRLDLRFGIQTRQPLQEQPGLLATRLRWQSLLE
jgi:hypothetical protein